MEKPSRKVGAKKSLYRLVKVSRQLALPTAPGLVARLDGRRCEATPLLESRTDSAGIRALASTLQTPDADDLGHAPQAAHDAREMRPVMHLQCEMDDGVGTGIALFEADIVDIRIGLADHRGVLAKVAAMISE